MRAFPYFSDILIQSSELNVAFSSDLRKDSLFKTLSRMDLLNSKVIVLFHCSKDSLVVFEKDFQRYLK